MRAGRACDLLLDRVLEFALYDRFGNLLFRPGGKVTCPDQRDRLLARGFVVQDNGREDASAPPVRPVPAAPRAVFESVRDLATRLQPLHSQLLDRTTLQFGTSLMGMAAQLDALAARDADAALASMHLHSVEEGLAPRLVHAAVLCRVLAVALQLDDAQRLSTLAAALTYDIALTPISARLNHQNAPLSADQRAVVDTHPDAACALLREAGIDDPIWLAAVAEHHERVDGSGYPRKLTGDAISLPGRVLGIVDSFSAMVRPRAYREAVLSRQALRDLFLQRSRSVDERLANIFVKEIGMYPPGSLVRLGNREVAVVVRRGVKVAHPQVRTVIYADGSRALTWPARDTEQPGLEIVEGVAIHKHRSVLASVHALWKAS